VANAPWLDEREQAAWRGFLRMSFDVDARIRRQLQRDAGLSDADYAVLVALSESDDGRLRITELARFLAWEKSRMSHQLRRMEGRGLVARQECETDARGAFAVITPEGRKAIEAVAPLHVAEVRRSFIDLLSRKQLDALVDIAETVLAGHESEACDG